jgi:quaternary ammonium compound-resistance protein SugE
MWTDETHSSGFGTMTFFVSILFPNLLGSLHIAELMINSGYATLQALINANFGSCTMAWFYLIVAGVLEVGWAVGLKYSEGLTKLGPSLATGVMLAASMALLGMALRDLPLGTAYAIWTGIGTAGTAILGIWLFGESAQPLRLACLVMIVAGIIGLKLLAGKPA